MDVLFIDPLESDDCCTWSKHLSATSQDQIRPKLWSSEHLSWTQDIIKSSHIVKIQRGLAPELCSCSVEKKRWPTLLNVSLLKITEIHFCVRTTTHSLPLWTSFFMWCLSPFVSATSIYDWDSLLFRSVNPQGPMVLSLAGLNSSRCSQHSCRADLSLSIYWFSLKRGNFVLTCANRFARDCVRYVATGACVCECARAQ